jgi:hypothetical protein
MSKKTGKLNKVEKFYIENNSDKEVSQIAKDLNRSEASVEKHMKNSPKRKHTSEAKSEEDVVSNLMGHNDRGSTVMTPAASELSDGTRSSRLSKNSNHNAIHKIK